MNVRGSKMPRAMCPECSRVCAVQPPRGGDGSVDVFPRHTRKHGRSGVCGSSRQIVHPGNYVKRA